MPRESSIATLTRKAAGSASDPLWFKDAIIYELHVKAFKDSNGDGIGDFPGLTSRLDYIADLGVTCLWLLPFFPSPLKDDGYDVSDYMGIHPMYGTMEEFQTFLNAAHDRGLQVMIELVVNHTSDQHPWFQAARNAPPGAPERDFYVWSDTDQKYQDARIIFTDTEKSNWTYDPVARAYYWHRFFSHQPDLNYDNPQVVEEVLKVMRFWLDMGVDALRVDAVPYLIEREGTNCENLPETHTVIRKLRAVIDEEYENRMLLAEANQWPTDVRPYFGDGDEFHMAFHFPLMPRMYVALRQEDRLPITDIIAQTPAIPESCQWGLFLRNHDELTLEMVTSDERDYMYLAYSADPRMRINLGIRRRLAPLVDNNRRRVELLNSLLFSLPGTPVLYYGDEIGMGDNIYLGDRNGVRTPMQWNSDRNAGFSTATPGRLYSPVVMDPLWGYEAINVEAQQSDPSSLLNWMRNMIALRKLFRVFGRGTIEFLHPANRKILAYLRTYDGEQVLCVANLSRFSQPVDLDLPTLEGATPVEMLGYVEFPPIEKKPYRLTLGPYGSLWLELHKPDPADARVTEPETALSFTAGWEGLLTGMRARKLAEEVLPEYLCKQRWFGGKSHRIKTTQVVDWTVLRESDAALVMVQVSYGDNEPADNYFLTMAATMGEASEEILKKNAAAVLCPITSGRENGVLHDATLKDETCLQILATIRESREIAMHFGTLQGKPTLALSGIPDLGDGSPVKRGSAEQSNTSIIFNDRVIVKLFRHYQAGPNPDCEIGDYLTNKVRFEWTPPFGGSIEYRPAQSGAEPSTVAMVQGLIKNEGDGWKFTVEELERYFETNAAVAFPDALRNGDITSKAACDYVGIYLDAAATLGRRTAEMHRALATPTDDPAFSPESFGRDELERLLEALQMQAARVFDVLKFNMAKVPDDVVEVAAGVLSRRQRVLDHFRIAADDSLQSQRIRIHGDYHLGQVLRVKTDFIILDFEGEPARTLAERRAKQSPLKDVAGMVRSFSYAAYSTLLNYTARRPEDLERLQPWARLWERAVSAEFLKAYRESAKDAPFVPQDDEAFRRLLDIFLFDKALYELTYELNSRPAWLRIPLMGILDLGA